MNSFESDYLQSQANDPVKSTLARAELKNLLSQYSTPLQVFRQNSVPKDPSPSSRNFMEALEMQAETTSFDYADKNQFDDSILMIQDIFNFNSSLLVVDQRGITSATLHANFTLTAKLEMQVSSEKIFCNQNTDLTMSCGMVVLPSAESSLADPDTWQANQESSSWVQSFDIVEFEDQLVIKNSYQYDILNRYIQSIIVKKEHLILLAYDFKETVSDYTLQILQEGRVLQSEKLTTDSREKMHRFLRFQYRPETLNTLGMSGMLMSPWLGENKIPVATFEIFTVAEAYLNMESYVNLSQSYCQDQLKNCAYSEITIEAVESAAAPRICGGIFDMGFQVSNKPTEDI